MKVKYSLILGVFSIAIGMTSCQKQVIDLTPPSSLTEADFYNTAADLDGAVLGIYIRYQARKPNDWAILELPTDNLHRTGYSTLGGTDEINNLAITAENPLFASFWQQTYNGIFRANAVIVNLDNPTDYAEGQRGQLEGEAKFMRALLYFELVRLFGDVPLVDKLLTIEESRTIPRSPASEIYTHIIQDLTDAINGLPERGSIATGRASKEAAVALLAKVHVYQEDWSNAKKYLDMLDTYGFQLQDDFASLWKIENEDNNEIIFAIKYTDGTNGHSLSTYFLPYFGVSGVSPRGLEAAFPSWDLHKHFEEGDTRKDVSIKEYWKSPGGPADAPEEWYPYVNKYAITHTPSASGLDLPVLRYADLVLLKAEVLYNLGQQSQALAELNRIRERAFKGSSHNYTAADIATPQAFEDKLLLERRLELAFEDERWYDLVRTGRMEAELAEVETFYNPVSKQATKVKLNPKSHYNLYPIPQRELEQSNTGVMTQNNGY